MKFFFKLVIRVSNLLSWISSIILLGLAIMITLDVVVRFIFGSSTSGVFEVSIISFMFITFLVLSWVQYSERQMKIDIVTMKIKKNAVYVLKAVNNLASLVFFVLMFWISIKEFIFAFCKGSLETGLISIPTVIPLSGIVLGSFIVCLVCLILIVKNILIIWNKGDSINKYIQGME